MQSVNKPLDESYLKTILARFRALARALVVGPPSNPNDEELYTSLLVITFRRDSRHNPFYYLRLIVATRPTWRRTLAM